MSERRLPSCCPQPASLVIVEAIPFCQIAGGAPDLPEADCEGPDRALAGAVGLPARCAATMSCSEALALMEAVGHVRF